MSGMTRKEAIKNLKELLKWYLEEELLSETVYKREAVDMAISALSEELSEDGTLTVHVSDGSKVTRVFVMGDNIFGGLYYPDSAKADMAKPKREYIDKTELVRKLNAWDCKAHGIPNYAWRVINEMPTYSFPDSAENKGEWIESKERSKHWYCSVCGGIHTDPETGKWRETFDYRYPFCPNCGADMRGKGK